MGLIRPSVLLFALLMTAPALYRFAVDELGLAEVLTRFLIAVPIAAVLLAGLRFVTSGYGEKESAVKATPQQVEKDTPAHPA